MCSHVQAVFCAQPDCEDYEEEVIPKGGCCPVCRCKVCAAMSRLGPMCVVDSALLLCACLQPSLCPVPLCLHGLPFTPEGECCQECLADCSVS